MKNSILFRYRHCSGLGRESGVALIMALICLFVMSTLAVGVLYSTQSEVWTTANYRAVTQARYVAEAGAQQALNYLQTLNLAGTVPIASSATFTTTNFNYATGMPVLYTPAACTGGPYTPPYTATACRPVIMATSGMSGTKYPDTYAAIDTALGTTFDTTSFQAAFTTAVTQTPFNGLSNCSGSSCPQFNVAVQLLTAYPNGTGWVTRWKIVSEGSLNTIGSSTSGGKALVQVVEIVDNVMVAGSGGSSAPTYSAGVVATGTGCGAITMSGGVSTNSYVGASYPNNATPPLANTGGNVATYGNINLSGSASIIGNVYSPFYNSGTAGTYGISGGPSGLNSGAACSTSGGTEYAVNESNSTGVGCTGPDTGCSQKTYPIPSPPPSYATPCLPSGNCASVPATVAANTTEPTSSSSGIFNGLLGGGSGGGHGCALTVAPSGGTAGGFTSPANFGDVNMGSCAVITLQAGVYNMDSLSVTNGAKIILPATGTVTINILDQGSVATPIELNGGTISNSGGNPGNFVIAYAGTKPIDISAGASMFATIYAPNASATMSGAGALYGALIVKTATFAGSGTVNYDSSLNGTNINVNTGPPPTQPGALHIDEFSWSAF